MPSGVNLKKCLRSISWRLPSVSLQLSAEGKAEPAEPYFKPFGSNVKFLSRVRSSILHTLHVTLKLESDRLMIIPEPRPSSLFQFCNHIPYCWNIVLQRSQSFGRFSLAVRSLLQYGVEHLSLACWMIYAFSARCEQYCI
jgi:hypothetical protein